MRMVDINCYGITEPDGSWSIVLKVTGLSEAEVQRVVPAIREPVLAVLQQATGGTHITPEGMTKQ